MLFFVYIMDKKKEKMVIEFFSYKMTFVQPIGNDRIWWIFGSFFSFHWGLIQWKNKNKDNSNNNNLLLSIWSTSDCLLPVVVDNNEERSAFIFFVCIFRFDLIFFCFVSHFKYEPVAICLFVDVFFSVNTYNNNNNNNLSQWSWLW